MRIVMVGLLAAVALFALYASLDMNAVAHWAAEQQRAFQNHMAGAVRALRAGDPSALAALLSAAAAYGFVHALGPGHGKYLIGGVGLGSSVSASRLLSIAALSSLAQAAWAIALVYGGFFVLELSAASMTALAEDYLAPVSHLAIAAIGATLIWRGARALSRRAATRLVQIDDRHLAASHASGHGGHHHASHRHDAHGHRGHHHHAHGHGAHDHGAHDHGECGCAGHGPTPDEVARLGSLRDAAMLIASIAIRPCTGAIFLLVIAWQMEIQAAGAMAVVVMGLGTALLTSIVALSSVAARGALFVSASGAGAAIAIAAPALQITAGFLIIWFSLMLLGFGL